MSTEELSLKELVKLACDAKIKSCLETVVHKEIKCTHPKCNWKENSKDCPLNNRNNEHCPNGTPYFCRNSGYPLCGLMCFECARDADEKGQYTGDWKFAN